MLVAVPTDAAQIRLSSGSPDVNDPGPGTWSFAGVRGRLINRCLRTSYGTVVADDDPWADADTTPSAPTAAPAIARATAAAASACLRWRLGVSSRGPPSRSRAMDVLPRRRRDVVDGRHLAKVTSPSVERGADTTA